jgi:hypothetical protein
MSLIAIQLHPKEPTDGDTFRGYLEGLVIQVSEVAFGDPPVVTTIGTAEYLTEGDPNATIVQHFHPFMPALREPAATAAIELASPLPFDEYDAPDLVMTITRTVAPNPAQTILYKQINFNVDLVPGSLPPAVPAFYAALGPTALYIPLPEPLTGIAAGMAHVDIPEDGTPPPFGALVNAVNIVLADDPGAPVPDLATLTPEQCRQIANEIVYNRTLDPLPQPSRRLGELYNGGAETERRQFEADLLSYYTLHNTRAEVLAKYIYSMAAAFECAARSQAATKVGFTFPVRPGLSGTSEKVGQATVIITQ